MTLTYLLDQTLFLKEYETRTLEGDHLYSFAISG